MTSSHRQKLITILLLLYWPAIFITTHIPKVPLWIARAGLSDKTLHYLGYLVLVFLLWFAVSPDRKVNWRRATVWWVLFVVAGYGAIDEWLQGYVGRSPDFMDFFANLTGAVIGLILLSIFSFWPASLALTAAAIFVLTNLMQANLADQLPMINAAFHLLAYVLFSLLWTRYMYHLLPVRAPQTKWLIGALALPVAFLLAVELFSAVDGNGFRLQNVLISLIGIAAAVGAIFLTALFRRRFNQKLSPSDT